MSDSTTVHLRRCLNRLADNDAAARTELVTYSQKRLADLANRMFQGFPSFRFREQSDDLLQESMLRLRNSLEEIRPITVLGFMGLAALQMRRVLCDLARNYSRKNFELDEFHAISSTGIRKDGVGEQSAIDDAKNAPDELACWWQFHQAADELSQPYRTAFDLLFYHELPRIDVAMIMGISVRQVQRYWNYARLKLSKKMTRLWQKYDTIS